MKLDSSSTAGAWRFAAVTPVKLTAGDYVIGAYYPTSADAFAALATVSSDPRINYKAGLITPGSINGFNEPISGSGPAFAGGFFGPNFEMAAVPEPESWSLIIGGLGLIGMALRREKGAAMAA